MRITKNHLKQLIKEELAGVINEFVIPTIATIAGAMGGTELGKAGIEALDKEKELELGKAFYGGLGPGVFKGDIKVPRERAAMQFAIDKEDWTPQQRHAFVNIQSGGDQEAILAALKARTYQQDYMNN